jgi:copper resistance protein C
MTYKKGIAVALSALAASLVASSALAHTALREATPADGTTVEALPPEVSALLGGVVTEGEIQVFDACGKSVTTGDTAVDAVSVRQGKFEAPGSKLRVPTQGTQTGNYQAIWTAVGTDGHAVGGGWDFDVKSDKACAAVTREDAKDNAKGIDITKIATKKLGRKHVLLTITAADALSSGSFSSAISEDKKGNVLDIVIENEQDDEADLRGRFLSRGKNEVALALTSDDLRTKYGRYVATLKGATVSVKIPQKAFRLEVGRHADIFVESTGNTEDCGTGCADVAPDYGFVRALSR